MWVQGTGTDEILSVILVAFDTSSTIYNYRTYGNTVYHTVPKYYDGSGCHSLLYQTYANLLELIFKNKFILNIRKVIMPFLR